MAVKLYGRWCFLVQSHSRDGLVHLVDFEESLNDLGQVDVDERGNKSFDCPRCGCEAWALRSMRPCRHIREVIAFIVDSLSLTAQQRDILSDRLEWFAQTGLDLPIATPQKPADPKKRNYTLKPTSQCLQNTNRESRHKAIV